MLIHKRSLIVLTAVTASVLGLVALALAIAMRLEVLSAQQAQPIVLLAFTLLFPIAIIGLFLFAEVATKYEKSEPWYMRVGGLHFTKLPELVQNCPRAIVRASTVLAAVSLGLFLWAGGKASWTEGKVLSSQELITFAAGTACLSFLILPAALSACRGRRFPHASGADDA